MEFGKVASDMGRAVANAGTQAISMKLEVTAFGEKAMQQGMNMFKSMLSGLGNKSDSPSVAASNAKNDKSEVMKAVKEIFKEIKELKNELNAAKKEVKSPEASSNNTAKQTIDKVDQKLEKLMDKLEKLLEQLFKNDEEATTQSPNNNMLNMRLETSAFAT